eukprot:1595831-Prymnesium_polylepis.1
MRRTAAQVGRSVLLIVGLNACMAALLGRPAVLNVQRTPVSSTTLSTAQGSRDASKLGQRVSPVTMAAPFFESYEDGIAGDDRPVLLYLPGIEGSALSLSKQTERLSAVFDVRWLTVPLDDRTPFEELVEIVRGKIAAETSSGGVYVAGESFGGVLALNVALGSTGRPPAGLKGLVLINPA